MEPIQNAHSVNCENVLNETKSNINGLTEIDAANRLLTHGKNKLPEGKKTNIIIKFLLQFKDVMIIILLLAAIISFFLKEYVDSIVILVIVILNAILGLIQEYKAEKALELLKKSTKPIVKVLRDGKINKISSEDLVVGDIVVLEAGDIVPADIRLIESAMLKCDESSLTGESEPITKNAQAVLNKSIALGDRINMAYSGSVVTYGRSSGVVVATGENTELGKIAKLIQNNKHELTPLQKSLQSVGIIISIVVIVIALIALVLELTRSSTTSIMTAVLTAIAIAVAAIPESLPAVVTIIMALGVSKLAKKKAIVKKLHAVETLGSCEIVCSDKTGTLTQNIMTVKKLYYNSKSYSDLDPDTKLDEFGTLMRIMCLCNDSKKVDRKYIGDPTETALTDFGLSYGYDKDEMEKNQNRIFEIPFDSKRKLMSTVNQYEDGNFLYCKGGIDEILSKCTKILQNGQIRTITNNDIKDILKQNKKMSGRALRILGGAFKPTQNENEYIEKNLIFAGMIGMLDPARADVEEAVQKCKTAGMRPIMITGDHKGTALAIAKEIGIANSSREVMTGTQMDKLSDDDFIKVLNNITVFARVSPENKVRIVETYKKMGKIVAMTGDGVNDAPSLKKANIGIGMGITGTDITKDVADIIITDDSFATIIIAISEGRKIFRNIQKTINFLFASNLCEVLAILTCIVLFPNLTFLLPIQILFTNLITDSLPAMSLGYEPHENDIMNQPPRDPKKTMFHDGVGFSIVIQGILQAILVIVSFIVGMNLGGGKEATTMAFLTLNFIQLFFVLSVRSSNSIFKINLFSNIWLLCTVIISALLLIIIALTPVGIIIGLTYLTFIQWLIVLGLSLLIIPLNEVFKLIISNLKKSKQKKENERRKTKNLI